ncbi:hypothetical protein B0T18DRAFT_482203 [Schizothecium vesticola]|uniref:Defect at low temperature protein 1 n=1 Tax=Schizothecium vesticola TaxID=314040 RepID=A0AA40EIX4_9PEZI|nr:hypothetical protein B0T18DRAFT_482203 [Schizothecium vesticola]
MSPTSLVFKIIYNFLYYFLYLVTLVLVLVTPFDLIKQAVDHGEDINILVIALNYLVTILVVVFIYATRLYLNRSVLAAIPRESLPTEKGEVPRDVRAMIGESLSRSAALAYEARPRLPAAAKPIAEEPAAEDNEKRQTWISRFRRGEKDEDFQDFAGGIEIPQHRPVWGDIEHPAWAPPTSPDMPSLHYEAVISELPHLIEAKALTLAPPDPYSDSDPPALDPAAVALLQRAESTGLREYLVDLTDLAVLAPLPATASFLAAYERARFSPHPLTNTQFRALMRLFADVLRNMHPLSAAALARGGPSSSMASSGDDIDDDAPLSSSESARSSGGASSYLAPPPPGPSSSRRPTTPAPPPPPRASSANTWQHASFRTAPTTPKSRHTAVTRGSLSSSEPDSFTQTRRPYPASEAGSTGGSEAGSVIRLAVDGDETDLPYVLRVGGAVDEGRVGYG